MRGGSSGRHCTAVRVEADHRGSRPRHLCGKQLPHQVQQQVHFDFQAQQVGGVRVGMRGGLVLVLHGALFLDGRAHLQQAHIAISQRLRGRRIQRPRQRLECHRQQVLVGQLVVQDDGIDAFVHAASQRTPEQRADGLSEQRSRVRSDSATAAVEGRQRTDSCVELSTFRASSDSRRRRSRIRSCTGRG